VIKVPKYTLVNVLRDGIFFLAILTAEGAAPRHARPPAPACAPAS